MLAWAEATPAMNYEPAARRKNKNPRPRSVSRLALGTQHCKERTKGVGDLRRLSYHADMGRLP